MRRLPTPINTNTYRFRKVPRPRNLWVTHAGLWPGLPITHTSLRPLFPRRRAARAVWRKEAVQPAAGGVERALLLLRAAIKEWPAVITDHPVEKPVRRDLPQRRILVEI